MEIVNKIRLKTGISKDILSKEYKVRNNVVIIILVIMFIAIFFFSFTIGRYAISLSELMNIFVSKLFGLPVTWDETVETVLFNVRIPRILAAILIGAALATSGASYQGLFRNPMVSPDILGASAGAGFGAALAILMSFDIVGIQLSAFLIGMAAVFLTYTISTIISRGNNAVIILILTGMVVSTLFASFISVTKYVADPESKLSAITFWLMGGLSSIRTKDTLGLLIPLFLGSFPIFLLRWKLNVLSFGEEEAQAMGIETRRIRLIIIVCSTLLTASSVSVCGIIGWIGLIIPHIARFIVGPNYKILLPVSMLIGSTFLLLVDDIARSAFVMEIPLGILTSLIGAPFFIYLLLKSNRRSS